MSQKKRYISKLTESEIQSLNQGYKSGPSHTYRCRCKAILLSHERWCCSDLSAFFEVSLQSIYSWLDRFESGGFAALSDKPGRGRKAILKVDRSDHVQVLHRVIDHSPRNLNKALSQIEDELGLHMSKKTLKRFLKKLTADGSDTANDRGNLPMKGFTKAR